MTTYTLLILGLLGLEAFGPREEEETMLVMAW